MEKLRTFLRPSSSDDAVLVRTSVKIITTLLLGVALSLLNIYLENENYKASLLSRAATIGAALDKDRIHSLATSVGESNMYYDYLHRELTAVKDANTDFRFVYIMDRKDNDIRFLADSEPVNSEDYSPPGEVYDDATPQLKNIFNNGKSFVEGPVTDDYGTWLSALVPIFNPENGDILAVVGADIPAAQYYSGLAMAAALPLLGAGIMAFIFLTSDSIRRRHLEAMRFRSELVSVASHELRTPLTGLRWGSESLMDMHLTKEQKRLAHDMHDSVLRLQEGVEDILQMASLQSKRSHELNIADNDLRKLMTEVASMQKLAASERGVTIELSANWPTTALAQFDALRMKRVFNNLLSNAVKYTRPNTTIIIDYQHKLNEGHLISITDKGIGIPANEQEKIFSGFYRASNAIKAQVNGTGMGLYLSRTVVEQHGGKVWLTSKEGVGTTATVLLPAN